jgi:DNA replication protein DnaC
MIDYKPLLAEQNIPPRYLNCDFESHEATSPRWAEIQEYVKKPNGNIFISGSCGNGKTLTATAICAAWASLHGRSAPFYNMGSLYSDWCQKSSEGQAGYFAGCLGDCPLLILDDLGQGEITDAFKRWLYSIINKRWEWERPTVLTTNLNDKEFRDMFGDAILSRLLDGRVWKFEGRDHRITRTY